MRLDFVKWLYSLWAIYKTESLKQWGRKGLSMTDMVRLKVPESWSNAVCWLPLRSPHQHSTIIWFPLRGGALNPVAEAEWAASLLDTLMRSAQVSPQFHSCLQAPTSEDNAQEWKIIPAQICLQTAYEYCLNSPHSQASLHLTLISLTSTVCIMEPS